MAEYSDQEIIQMLKNESEKEKGFKILVQQTERKLYAFIRRMVQNHDDTDDVLQNTYIKIWKGIESFREESQLITWMYRIASNECINHLNKQKRKFGFLTNNEFESNRLEADELVDYSNLEQSFEKAISSLPEKQKLIFNLKFYENKKYEEISDILGVSTGALKASYHIAVKKIEKIIGRL